MTKIVVALELILLLLKHLMAKASTTSSSSIKLKAFGHGEEFYQFRLEKKKITEGIQGKNSPQHT